MRRKLRALARDGRVAVRKERRVGKRAAGPALAIEAGAGVRRLRRCARPTRVRPPQAQAAIFGYFGDRSFNTGLLRSLDGMSAGCTVRTTKIKAFGYAAAAGNCGALAFQAGSAETRPNHSCSLA